MSDNPQVALERQYAARHLVQQPFTCAEHDVEMFRLIRRHASDLDRWFTQRLGYRLHLDADTARLFKSGVLVEHRPLRTSTDRAFHQLEYILLALVLASTAAGPAIISLRDLVDQIRSAAAEADIALSGDATERRALVTVLRWMIDHGLAVELHSHVDAYAGDDSADAVLKVRPDRITLMPLPALVGVDDAHELLRRAERRSSTRQWLRGRLVEAPVIYRDDLTDDEWSELRRRLGEEDRILDEMFGLVLEARAEGVAAIDPSGSLAERRFPGGGTVGHCALLLIDELREDTITPMAEVIEAVTALAARHAKRWANDLVNAPERLARHAIDLLVEQRLAERIEEPAAIRVLAGAARFAPLERDEVEPASAQVALW